MTTLLALVDGRMRDDVSGAHLASDRVAALLDGRLTGADRADAVRHLADCPECRREFSALRDVVDTARPARTARWLTAAAGVAAVFLLMVLPFARQSDSGDPGTGAMRANEPAVPGATMSVVEPADGAIVARQALRLAWKSAGPGATYSVIVQDSAGAPVWSAEPSDTSVTIPDSVTLARSARYLWSVDARLADGRSDRTQVHRFIVK